mgnify:CR=1 FL=1
MIVLSIATRTLSLASSASARAAAASSSCAFDGADADDAPAAPAADAPSSTAAWRSPIRLSRALSFFRDCRLFENGFLFHAVSEGERGGERGREKEKRPLVQTSTTLPSISLFRLETFNANCYYSRPRTELAAPRATWRRRSGARPAWPWSAWGRPRPFFEGRRKKLKKRL